VKKMCALVIALAVAGISDLGWGSRALTAHGNTLDASEAIGAATRPLAMSKTNLDLVWGIIATQEQGCGGGKIAGGEARGTGNVTHLGRSTVSVSAAWDINRLIASPEFQPIGPAGGPVATVLGRGEYPYTFHANPFSLTCGSSVAATGRVEFTAANGDRVFGNIVGGETHRLDFIFAGDGIETFAHVEIAGGTGRFTNASGAVVSHTMTRFFPSVGTFLVVIAELLPGGTIAY
jgi:hypothetical protein